MKKNKIHGRRKGLPFSLFSQYGRVSSKVIIIVLLLEIEISSLIKISHSHVVVVTIQQVCFPPPPCYEKFLFSSFCSNFKYDDYITNIMLFSKSSKIHIDLSWRKVYNINVRLTKLGALQFLTKYNGGFYNEQSL